MITWIFQKISLERAIFLALLGFILGVSLKNIAMERITMGYEDYKLEKLKSDYVLMEKIEKENETVIENSQEGD